MKKITPKSFLNFKKEGKKITMLTAYDYSTAMHVDEAGIDSILVGDSLGMVVLGYETTHKVTIENMELFTSAVARGAKRALIVADMPFGSYHSSKEQAVEAACKLIKAGAQSVKLEGGSDYIVDIVEHLSSLGIPVVAHLGFTPQYLYGLGGYTVQGKTFEKTKMLLQQALKLQKAGAFALVLEMVSAESAKYITENLDIPTIGIGAGVDCSGQVLVIDDMLGKYGEFCPKFAKKYADIKSTIIEAARQYISEVEASEFPTENETFRLSNDEAEKLYGCVK